MADRNPQTVAALALTYRELHNAHILSPKDFVDDREAMPDELGLLVRAVAAELTELDWLVLKTFDQTEHSWAVVAEEVYGVDPSRAEAMLHAWPPDGGLAPIGVSRGLADRPSLRRRPAPGQRSPRAVGAGSH